MILVLLGTFHIPFKRPLVALERLCASGKINEEVIVQNGHTQFSSPHLKTFPFIDPALLDKFYDSARLIITHAGTGSIIKGLKKKKKVIAIARLHRLGEHIDDHQLEILNQFAGSNYILPWRENERLEEVLQRAESFRSEKGAQILGVAEVEALAEQFEDAHAGIVTVGVDDERAAV